MGLAALLPAKRRPRRCQPVTTNTTTTMTMQTCAKPVRRYQGSGNVRHGPAIDFRKQTPARFRAGVLAFNWPHPR
jgi:hypothetical protein